MRDTIRKSLVFSIVCVGCGRSGGSSPSGPTAHEYVPDERDGIHVSVKVPAGWTEEIDKLGSPSFTPPGSAGGLAAMIGVTSVHCPAEADADACVDSAVALNFDGPTKVERGANGARWVTAEIHAKANQLHERRFIPVVAKHVVVMCIGVLNDDERRFAADVRTMCDTMTVAP
jgi:hypothetical protein